MNEKFNAYRLITDRFGFLDMEIVPVFNVRDDKNGYPHFLIYEDKQWKYVSAKHFLPYDVAAEIVEQENHYEEK